MAYLKEKWQYLKDIGAVGEGTVIAKYSTEHDIVQSVIKYNEGTIMSDEYDNEEVVSKTSSLSSPSLHYHQPSKKKCYS